MNRVSENVDCRCECKEIDDWGSCGYLRNTSMCHCECNKACKVDI